MHDDKPPKKKRERAAWDAAARLNALGIKATANGVDVRVAGFRMIAPQRTGGWWNCALGSAWDGAAERETAEATLDEALRQTAQGATAKIGELHDMLAAEQKKLATCASLRAKLAATAPEGDPK